MKDADLFQLGYGLETGAHEEDNRGGTPVNIVPRDVLADRSHNVLSDGPNDVLSDGPNDVLSDGPNDVLSDGREDHFIRDGDSVYAGNHLIIEVVNGHGLDDEARIRKAFRDCVEVCGATLLHIHTHKFSPQGVSGVAVLAESHISVHTWPEIGYGAFDVFMCGDAQPWRSIDVLKRAFGTADVRVKALRRGEGLVDDAVVAA